MMWEYLSNRIQPKIIVENHLRLMQRVSSSIELIRKIGIDSKILSDMELNKQTTKKNSMITKTKWTNSPTKAKVEKYSTNPAPR